MLKQWWSLVELIPSIQRMQYCNLSPKHEGTMLMSFKVDVILRKINCLISWYHGTRFANLSKYTWLLSSLHQKGECFKDWQVMVGPSQTPLGGAATIESAVRSVLSPRLAHKTGLNRQKIITFLSHSVAPRQGNKTAHKTGRILLHRCHIFVAHKNSWTLTGKGLLPCCHISVAPQNCHILLTPLDGPPSNSTFLLAPLFSFLPSYPTSPLGHQPLKPPISFSQHFTRYQILIKTSTPLFYQMHSYHALVFHQLVIGTFESILCYFEIPLPKRC